MKYSFIKLAIILLLMAGCLCMPACSNSAQDTAADTAAATNAIQGTKSKTADEETEDEETMDAEAETVSSSQIGLAKAQLVSEVPFDNWKDAYIDYLNNGNTDGSWDSAYAPSWDPETEFTIDDFSDLDNLATAPEMIHNFGMMDDEQETEIYYTLTRLITYGNGKRKIYDFPYSSVWFAAPSGVPYNVRIETQDREHNTTYYRFYYFTDGNFDLVSEGIADKNGTNRFSWDGKKVSESEFNQTLQAKTKPFEDYYMNFNRGTPFGTKDEMIEMINYW